jgi:hypothetical protein
LENLRLLIFDVSASRVGLLVYRYTHLSFRADPYNAFFQLFLEKEKIYNAISAVFQGRMSKTTHMLPCAMGSSPWL